MNTSYRSVQIFGVDKDTDKNNPKLVPNWKNIDKIFKQDNVAKNALKFIVVCGEPRIGKSTFCNILYNDIEWIDSNDNGLDRFNMPYYNDIYSNEPDAVKLDKTKKEIEVIKKLFETSDEDHQAKTSGIWITTKPIQSQNWKGNKVNTFIVDVEGVKSSNSDKFIYQQLFVLSAMMSTHFINFIREPFNEHHYKIMKTYSTLPKLFSAKFQKLIFLISNIPNEKKYKYGKKSSKKYIESLKNGADINLEEFNSYFKHLKCFLLPIPGEKIYRKLLDERQDYYKIEDIGDEYLKYCLEFREKVLKSKFKKDSENKDSINGEEFALHLRVLYGLVESKEKLEQIPNEMRLLADNKNEQKINEISAKLNMIISPLCVNFVHNLINREDIEDAHRMQVENRLQEFSENVWSSWPGTNDRNFKKELETKLNYGFNKFMHNYNIYEDCLQKYLLLMNDYIKQIDSIGEMTINNNTNCNELNVSHKHRELVQEIMNEFRTRFIDNSQTYGIPFEILLSEQITNIGHKTDESIKYYLNNMKPVFRDLIECRINEEEVRRSHKEYVEMGLEIFNTKEWKYKYNKYMQILKNKLDSDFNRFLSLNILFQDSYSNYKEHMILYIQHVDIIDEDAFNNCLNTEHAKYYLEIFCKFKTETNNKYIINQINLIEELEAKVRHFYEPLKECGRLLNELINKYDEKILNAYNNQPWLFRTIISSNGWIQSDNQVIEEISEGFSDLIISKNLKECEKEILDKLFFETVKIINKKYDKCRTTENIVGGATVIVSAGTSAAAVVVGTVGAVAVVTLPIIGAVLGVVAISGMGYFVTRELIKPKKKRDDFKKNE